MCAFKDKTIKMALMISTTQNNPMNLELYYLNKAEMKQNKSFLSSNLSESLIL